MIYLKSAKFLPALNEDEELVNPGMYGKSLCQYLAKHLTTMGWSVPAYVPEDWGWLVECFPDPAVLPDAACHMICVYCYGIPYYAVAPTCRGNRFSWSKLRFVPLPNAVEQLHTTLLEIFQSDPDVRLFLPEDMPV